MYEARDEKRRYDGDVGDVGVEMINIEASPLEKRFTTRGSEALSSKELEN